MKNKRIIFFGNEKLATGVSDQPLTLPAFIQAGYKVEALVLSQKPHRGDTCASEKLAREHTIPVFYWTDVATIKLELDQYSCEYGVVIAFGRIIPEEIIHSFSHGLINLHPSLLPQYRGPSPIEQTILDGCTNTGVSIIQLGVGMDAGPILVQEERKISNTLTKQELAKELHTLGTKMIIDVLTQEVLHANEQSTESVSYTKKVTKQNGQLLPTDSMLTNERKIRAYAGWPTAYLDWSSKRIVITEAHTSSEPVQEEVLWHKNKHLYMSCSDVSLEILRLKVAGKNEVSAAEFIAAYQPPQFT